MIMTHDTKLITDIPGAPQSVQVVDVTSTTITLSWSPPLRSERFGLLIYNYTINCSTHSHSKHDSTVKTTENQNATLSNLLPFTYYNCCIAVNSAHGRGKLSCLNVVTCESWMNYHTLLASLSSNSAVTVATLTFAFAFIHRWGYPQNTQYSMWLSISGFCFRTGLPCINYSTDCSGHPQLPAL